MPETILVPLDGSALALAALEPAAQLAAKLPAELLLLQVLDSANYGDLLADPALWKDPEPDLAQARSALEAVAEPLRTRGLAARVHAEVGAPAVTIATVAEQEKATMIAMATHGRGGIAHLLLGSVAEAVLRRVHVPLLLVRPESVRR
jgi:nucleotide-binding universal stress UspA family protein